MKKAQHSLGFHIMADRPSCIPASNIAVYLRECKSAASRRAARMLYVKAFVLTPIAGPVP